MFKLDLEKAEEPEIKLPTSVASSKKAREFQKNIYLCFIVYAKAIVWIKTNSSKDVNTRPSDLPPEETFCRSRSNS